MASTAVTATLAALAGLFAQLSLLAFGGGNSVLPEMQRQVVDVHGWMNAAQFVSLFALAQAAPGPNLMVCALIGWQVAGLPGAIVSMAGICGPSSLLTLGVASTWQRFRAERWRKTVQAGLVPVTVGLVCAAGALVAVSAASAPALAAITAAVGFVALRSKLHPLWLLAAGALLGVLGGLAGLF